MTGNASTHGLGISGKRAAVAAASGGLGLASAKALAAEGRGRGHLRARRSAHRRGGGSGRRRVRRSGVRRRRRGRRRGVRRRRDGGARGRSTSSSPTPAGRRRATSPRTDVDAYPDAIALNLMSVVAMCKAAVPAMQERGWGRVVAITSVAVRQPIPELILSNTARAGATGFLKTLAREVAADGVTVNSIAARAAPHQPRHRALRRRGRRDAHGRRRRLRRHRRLPVQRAGQVPHRRPGPRRRRLRTRPCSDPSRTCSRRSPLAASRARRVSTLARWVRYSTLALRSACGSASAAACSAASATDAPPASADATLEARIGDRAHVDEPDAGVAVAPPRGDADDRPVLGPPVELLEPPPGALHLRHADLGEQLVGRQRGGEEALEEVGGGDLARAVGALGDVGRARARASSPAGRTPGRRGRSSRRSCPGGAPADRRRGWRRGPAAGRARRAGRSARRRCAA